MKLLNTIILAIASIALGSPAWAQEIPVDATIIESNQPLAPVQKIQSGYFEASGTQVQQILQESIENNRNSHTQLLITTDSPNLFAEIETKINNTNSTAIGLLADPTSSEQTPEAKASYIKRSLGYAKESIRLDAIGVIITTVVVGADIWQWVHASQYTSLTMAGNILTNLVVNLGLGLRKNTWAELNNKFASKAVSPILKSVGFKNLTSQRAELIVKMISNFTMVMTVQAIRLGFIVGGGSGDVLMGHSNYHYTDVVIKAGVTAFLVATAFSFNGFGWDNWISKNEKFGQNPIAKFLAYRFHEGRTLLTGMHITSAALMSPTIYGYSSWAWVAVNGTVGLTAYLHNNFTSKLLLESAEKIAHVSQRFSEKTVSFKKLFGRSALRCESIFSN